ncbi:glycoside hydrolase family 97 C-terminal domain-containing protein, partial [Bacteroides ovatus]
AKYIAQIYADGDDAEWKTNPTSFKYEEKTVTASDTLHVKLATSGGCAIRFIKQ